MATIYDDILVIDDETEDSADAFLGQGRICLLTQEAKATKDAIEVAEKQKWMLDVVETEIIKAAKEGKYSTNLIVPANYNIMEVQQFLIKAGYQVKTQSSTSRNITISWDTKSVVITVNAKLYITKDNWTESLQTFTAHVSQGTLINKQFIIDTFKQEAEWGNMIFELQTENYNEYDLAGPSLTNIEELNIIALKDLSLYLPYLKKEDITD